MFYTTVVAGIMLQRLEDAKMLKHNTLETTLMVLRKREFCYEERECENLTVGVSVYCADRVDDTVATKRYQLSTVLQGSYG